MRVLHITEICPIHEKPAVDPFIMQRIHALQAEGPKVTVLSLYRYTSVTGKDWIMRRMKQLNRLLFGQELCVSESLLL